MDPAALRSSELDPLGCTVGPEPSEHVAERRASGTQPEPAEGVSSSALVLAGGELPRIAFVVPNPANRNAATLFYVSRNRLFNWTTETVDLEAAGAPVSAALDPSGRVHISYRTFTGINGPKRNALTYTLAPRVSRPPRIRESSRHARGPALIWRQDVRASVPPDFVRSTVTQKARAPST